MKITKKALESSCKKLAKFLTPLIKPDEGTKVHVHAWDPHWGGVRLSEVGASSDNAGWSWMRSDAISTGNEVASLFLACEEWLVGDLLGPMESTPPGYPLDVRGEAEDEIRKIVKNLMHEE